MSVEVSPPVVRRRLPSARSADTTIALPIPAAATWLGILAACGYRAAGGARYFYQSDFGPAVLLDVRRRDADLSGTIRDHEPLLSTTTLRADWRQEPLYHRLR